MGIKTRIKPVRDGAFLHFFRNGKLECKPLRLGPNHVHAFITHPDGSIDDLGISKNLLTNSGRDLWANSFGHLANAAGTATATSATSMTGSGFAVNQYMGWRVFMPVTALTNAPVYGNIISNTSTVLTLDQWWTYADAVGATPGSNGYYIIPTCVPRFMALDMTATAPVAADLYLQAEITTGGCARKLASFVHAAGTATYTQQTVYNVTASFANIYKMGLFTSLNPSATAGAQIGIMVFETALNTTASVNNGDTLTVTDTITLSG